MSAVDQVTDVRELYRSLILDHARKPRHFGKLPEATHSADGINPLCGDKLHLYLAIDDGGHINNAAFEGSGCAISVASASLLTDMVIGLDRDTAMGWFESVTRELTGTGNGAELGKLQALTGVKEFPARVKCATLAWHALKAAIEHEATTASTE